MWGISWVNVNMLLGDAIDDVTDYSNTTKTDTSASEGKNGSFETFDGFLKAMHASAGDNA